jgi:hypothetical protein
MMYTKVRSTARIIAACKLNLIPVNMKSRRRRLKLASSAIATSEPKIFPSSPPKCRR